MIQIITKIARIQKLYQSNSFKSSASYLVTVCLKVLQNAKCQNSKNGFYCLPSLEVFCLLSKEICETFGNLTKFNNVPCHFKFKFYFPHLTKNDVKSSHKYYKKIKLPYYHVYSTNLRINRTYDLRLCISISMHIRRITRILTFKSKMHVT